MLFTLKYIVNITDFNIWFFTKYIAFEILKNLVELYLPLNMILFDFLFFLSVSCGLWGSEAGGSPSNWTWTTAVKALAPNHWTARKFLFVFFLSGI